MIRRVPIQDATGKGENFALEGTPTDVLPKDDTIYIDETGKTYDPKTTDIALRELPDRGVLQLPRTTWWQHA
jgi:hypothetical protein